MSPSQTSLTSSQAAARLSVSAKALRLWEDSGLVTPERTAAGWRAYSATDMARATEVAAMRSLGLSLAQTAKVLRGDAGDLDSGLAAHEASLQDRARQLADTLDRVRRLRSDLLGGRMPAPGDLADLCRSRPRLSVAFDLPWPWGGEPFELNDPGPLTFITGPLGSGKTRLAARLAEVLPGARFIGLDRMADDGAVARAHLDADPALRAHVERGLSWIVDEGGQTSHALTALLAALHADDADALVVDMVEQDLDQATQEALMAYVRHHAWQDRFLFFMTRSSSILDLDSAAPGERIFYCPANHSPPMCVVPIAGTPGYETVATCLAPPEVRARTAGVVAWRPQAAGNR